MKKKKTMLLFLLLALVFILPSCTAKDPEDGLISGAKRRRQKETEILMNTASTIYTVPEMDLVKVKVNDIYADEKYMDIYYPPDFSFVEKHPTVIIYNGFAGIGAKNMGRCIDWATLVAAHGMIAVTYEPHYPEEDIKILLNNLVKRADELCIDAENLGMVCYCGNCPDGLREFVGNDDKYSGSLHTGVFLYGAMPWNDDIRKDSAMLLIETGKGLESSIKKSMNIFVETALKNTMDVELINYENGYKYFDVTEKNHKPWEYGVDSRYTADCDVMKEILSWMQIKMLDDV